MIDHRGTEFAELLRDTSAGLAELIGTRARCRSSPARARARWRPRSSTRCRPATGPRRHHRRSATDSPRSRARSAPKSSASRSRRVGLATTPAEHLAGADPYRAVLVTHNETSTGVANPLRSPRRSRARGARRTAPGRRRDQWPRGNAVRDGPMGRRPRHQRQPEGLDGVARDRDRGPRAAPSPPARRRDAARLLGLRRGARVGRARARRHGRRPSPSCTGSASASVGCARRAASGRGRATPPSRVPSPPASRRSGCASSPSSRIGRQPSPPRGCPTASTGRRSTPTCAAAASSWPAARASGPEDPPVRAHGRCRDRRDGGGAAHHGRDAPGARFAADAEGGRPHRKRGLRDCDRTGSVTGVSPQRLVVVRHGVTDWNREGRCRAASIHHCRRPGSPRRALAGRVADDPALRPARIASSTLARASRPRRSSVGRSTSTELESRLVEIGAGEWRGVPRGAGGDRR